MASPLLSELPFGSYLVYSPRGTSEVSKKSRRFRDAIKAGREATIRNLVAHLARNFASTELSTVLGSDVTLVPAPGSGVLMKGGLWPSLLIAEELVAASLGRQVLTCLERIEPVPKSAFQAPGERPTARKHYETMRATSDLAATPRITIVDDFVTKGNTLLGATSQIAEAYPRATLGAFALVRTMGLQLEVPELVESCVGRIWLASEDTANREP